MRHLSRKSVAVVLGILVMIAVIFIGHTKAGTYKIVQVYDGDTIAVDMQGTPEKIRMIGADTPETVDPRKSVQCYGPEASAYTHSHLLVGMRVRLVADPLSTDRDRYNRLLRYIYLKDGTLYNQKIIELGFAHAYTGFPFTKMQQFKSSQQSAQVAKIGLYNKCN